MQITQTLPDTSDNIQFCLRVKRAIKRNELRKPCIIHTKNKRGENIVFVVDDTISIHHGVVSYVATGEPLLPQYC
jgi:hypothetical protein